MVANIHYYRMFLHFINRIHDNAQKTEVLRQTVDLIRGSFSKQPILAHLFRGFLARGISMDLITMSLSEDERIRAVCDLFESKASENKLSVSQFDQIKRLLLKTKEFSELARMILRVAADKVTLRKDVQPDSKLEAEAFIWTCSDRLKEVKQISKFLSD